VRAEVRGRNAPGHFDRNDPYAAGWRWCGHMGRWYQYEGDPEGEMACQCGAAAPPPSAAPPLPYSAPSLFDAPEFYEEEPPPGPALLPAPPPEPEPLAVAAALELVPEWQAPSAPESLEQELPAPVHSPTDPALFDAGPRQPITLADRFVVPPLSTLDRRAGYWQDRRRRWLSLGMQSELGREHVGPRNNGAFSSGLAQLGADINEHSGLSIFDPVLCELAYRWFSPSGGRVLDPFAGGSVRGLVASALARWYIGVDLSGAQVSANHAQAHLASDIPPVWVEGDSRQLDDLLDPTDEFDLIFTCPPYADLERYSDNPADISTMRYPEFLEAQSDIIRAATGRLRRHRFAVWVTSDVREPGHGPYRGLVGDTVRAFQAAGLRLYNDAVVLDPIGTAPQRAGLAFNASRKIVRVHQHLLVFLKGDAKQATKACGGEDAVAG
jgi:hypothetical protein